MRASTSGHANLIRDDGNTDPRHGGKRLAYTKQKGQPKWHGCTRTKRTPPASDRGQRPPPKYYTTSKVQTGVGWVWGGRATPGEFKPFEGMRVSMSIDVGGQSTL